MFFTKKNVSFFTVKIFLFLFSFNVMAGGIMLSGTRVVYPVNDEQVTMSIKNTSEKSSFLVQSWVEDSAGEKTKDFVIAPPLYVSNPKNENKLRIFLTKEVESLVKEQLYYLNVKSVPSIAKNQVENKNMLMLASITRIKLFLRPDDLPSPTNDVYEKMKFTVSSGEMTMKNPTPYYLTLAHIKIDNENLKDTMVAPYSERSVRIKPGAYSMVKYRVVNDFGSVSKEFNSKL